MTTTDPSLCTCGRTVSGGGTCRIHNQNEPGIFEAPPVRQSSGSTSSQMRAFPEITETSKLANIWFSRVQDGFAKVVTPFAGKPIVYCEIGCWAGACAEFVAKNVLTHPDSLGIGIDAYPPTRIADSEEVKALAAKRVEFLGDRWQWIYELSNEGLRTAEQLLGKRKIDLAYIDGCHAGSQVIQDWCNIWPMLRIGSVVIFDDYWHRRAAKELWPHVRDAVIGIELSFSGMIKRVEGLDKRQIGFEVVRKCLPLIADREAVMKAQPKEYLTRQQQIRTALSAL